MPCYGCGSPEGTELRLCPTCIEQKRAARTQIKSDVLSATKESELVYDLMQDPWMRASMVGHAITVCFIFLLFTGPVSAHGPLAAFLFASMVSCSLVSMFIAALFWVRLILNDFMWALASLILPCLIYKYVKINWDQPEVRVYFYVHLGGLFLTLALAGLLSLHLNISISKIWHVFDLYMHGKQVPLSSEEYYFAY